MTLIPILAALSAPMAHAASYASEALPIDDLARRSDRVIRGEVLSTRTENTDMGIFTIAMVEVYETLRGDKEIITEIRVPGGKYGGIEMHVTGSPRLIEGDEVVLFLDDNRIVGMNQGALIVQDDHAWRPGRLGAFAVPMNLREWLQEMPADGSFEAWHLDDIRSAVAQ